jgi:hypothetical protein
MIEDHENLWLDTAMAMADYLPGAAPPPLSEYRADRVMYGTDFPNIPYAWDRELGRILKARIAEDRQRLLLAKNAADFFGLPPPGER